MATEGRAGVVVVAEVDSDWARRELMLAWSAWTADFEKRNGAPGPFLAPFLATSGGLVNDVACMRWRRDPTTSTLAKRSDRLRERPEVVAGWSLVVAMNGRAEAVTSAAKGLVCELHACRPARIVTFPQPVLPPSKRFSQAPAALQAIGNTGFGKRWLTGARLDPLADLVFPPMGSSPVKGKRAADLADSLPVLAPLCSGSGTAWRSVWRGYALPASNRAVRAGASAALLDRCRSAFERSELELACITLLEKSCEGLELIGTAAPTSLAEAERITEAVGLADRMADGLGYAVAEPRYDLGFGTRTSGNLAAEARP